MRNETADVEVVGRRDAMARLFALATIVAMIQGCFGVGSTDSVDSSRARDALKTALDGWKKGETPESLKAGSPPIVVQDVDWIAGSKLLDYAVDGEGKELESNLYVPVNLTLQGKQGKKIKKRVSYVIATSPQLMVFRGLN